MMRASPEPVDSMGPDPPEADSPHPPTVESIARVQNNVRFITIPPCLTRSGVRFEQDTLKCKKAHTVPERKREPSQGMSQPAHVGTSLQGRSFRGVHDKWLQLDPFMASNVFGATIFSSERYGSK